MLWLIYDFFMIILINLKKSFKRYLKKLLKIIEAFLTPTHNFTLKILYF